MPLLHTAAAWWWIPLHSITHLYCSIIYCARSTNRWPWSCRDSPHIVCIADGGTPRKKAGQSDVNYIWNTIEICIIILKLTILYWVHTDRFPPVLFPTPPLNYEGTKNYLYLLKTVANLSQEDTWKLLMGTNRSAGSSSGFVPNSCAKDTCGEDSRG